MRQDELRTKIRALFQDSIEQHTSIWQRRGIAPGAIAALEDEMLIHEQAIGNGPEEFSDCYLEYFRESLRATSALPEADWEENQASIDLELRRGRRDQIRALLTIAESLQNYSYDILGASPAESANSASATSSKALGAALEDFFLELEPTLPQKTVRQYRAYLNILVEHFGETRELATITRQDAAAVKKLLLRLPSNRNTKPALKNLSLLEAVEAPGHPKISPKTLNSHIDTFRRFFEWAEQHGLTTHVLFENMKVASPRKSPTERKPFSKEQMAKMLEELTQNNLRLVRSESHKWGTLLAMFTGARLNEICQLEVKDVQERNGIWYLDITDEGDNNKRVKADASKREVPLHAKLIEYGFLEFLDRRRVSSERLFPDYSYSNNGGYGRALGRWFNETFLPKLAIKSPQLVFHCFRHTMATRLNQADVPEPLVRCIIGHAQEGVTREVYMREGYGLKQLHDALQKFDL